MTDSETKQPLAGVTVVVTPMRKHGGMPIRTATDQEGRYRVSDREGERYTAIAYPPTGSGYVPRTSKDFAWKGGERELRLDIGLRRGVLIRGRVLEKDTGKPVSRVSVVYQPKRGNAHIRDHDEFRSPTLTDAEGRFALTGLPGPGVVVAESSDAGYLRHPVSPVDFGDESSLHVHGLARIDLPAEGAASEVVMMLEKGFTIEAKAVRPDGSAPDVVRAWCPELASSRVWPEGFLDGDYRLPDAQAGHAYRVFFLDDDMKSGTVVTLAADPNRKRPITVKLEPTASIRGRVLNLDGTPLDDGELLLTIQLIDKGGVLNAETVFDDLVNAPYVTFTTQLVDQMKPSKFHCTNLIPGARYFVTWFTREGGFFWHTVEGLRPGENRDLGDLRSDRKNGVINAN